MKMKDYKNASRIERLTFLRETIQELIAEGNDMADILSSVNAQIEKEAKA